VYVNKCTFALTSIYWWTGNCSRLICSPDTRQGAKIP